MTFVKLWGPVLLVMGLIYSQSAKSDPAAPPGGMSDKSAHFLAYAVLGATVVRALAGGRPSAMTAGRIALAAFVATLYGVSDESTRCSCRTARLSSWISPPMPPAASPARRVSPLSRA